MGHALHEAFFWFGLLTAFSLVLASILALWRAREERRQPARDRYCAACGSWTKGQPATCAFCSRSFSTGLIDSAALLNPENIPAVLRGRIESASYDGETVWMRTVEGYEVTLQVQQIAMTRGRTYAPSSSSSIASGTIR